MANSYMGQIKEFTSQCDWMIFKQKLNQFFVANEVNKEEIKRALLLNSLSEECFKLMHDLCVPESPTTRNYDELVKLFDVHFTPSKPAFAERYKFYSALKNRDESIAEWAARVKSLAANCKFESNHLNIMIRDRFIMGLDSGPIRDRLFEEEVETLELAKAIEIALKKEVAAKNFHMGTWSNMAIKPETSEVFQMSDSRGQQREERNLKSAHNNRHCRKECARGDKARTDYDAGGQRRHGDERARTKTKCTVCGKYGHMGNNCKYKDYVCNNCGIKGHLAYVCCKNNRKKKEHNYLSENNNQLDTIFNIKEIVGEPITVSVLINGNNFDFELDTGASCSVISSQFKNKYLSEIEILPNDKVLYNYNGQPMLPVGYVKVDICYKHLTKKIDLYIIDSNGPPLLGRNFYYLFKLSINKINGEINSDKLIRELFKKYENVFLGELGSFSKGTLKLSLKNNATPKFFKARPLPFALRDKVETEINRLLKLNIIESIEYSPWGTPIVPILKKDGTIRLCGDYKVTINKVLEIDQYPLPRIEELFTKVQGASYFSKIDLSNAYQQVKLDKHSQIYTTISTHKGLFKYTRLPYGIACAPAKFQRIMESLLGGLEGVAVFLDDIIVCGKNTEEHLNRLGNVFKILDEANLKIKREKCDFFKRSITYLGHKIDGEGLHTTPEKISAIKNAPKPQNIKQLQSFLGLVNYYGKFIPNCADLLNPLYKLLRKNADFNWTQECDNVFNKTKEVLCSATVLTHFDPSLPIYLSVDASNYGMGAVISHILPSGEERPIAFASRTLNVSQKRYSQIEKEALAIIFGVNKFYQYLYGQKFTLKTDHKPLVAIFGSKKGIPVLAANRLQRWALILANFEYDIEYVRSKDNNADGLSRLPQKQYFTEVESQHLIINYIKNNNFIPIDFKIIATETDNDSILKNIKKFIKSGWPSKIKNEYKEYYLKRNELTIDKGCLLFGYRVIIPLALRKRILSELHASHMGMVKTKSVARSYVWWPYMGKDIENMVRNCENCLLYRDNPPKAVLIPWEIPNQVWERIHIDYLGPIFNKYILVIVDAYSKWIEAFVVNNMTTLTTINILRSCFARFGIPKILVSDNGRQFIAEEFQNFLRMNGITPKNTAPYQPATNGAAENTVKTVKKSIFKAVGKVKEIDFNTILNRFLLDYRNAPHCTTGISPAKLMFGRKLRTRLDLIRPTEKNSEKDSEVSELKDQVREVIAKKQKTQIKNYSGNRQRMYGLNEIVAVRDYRCEKPSWIKGKIIKVLGPRTYLVYIPSLEKQWKRHVNQIIDYSFSINPEVNIDYAHKEAVNKNEIVTRCSNRIKKPPKRLIEEM